MRKIHSVGLIVGDYDRMLAFYRDVMGMTVVRRFEDRDAHKACVFDLGGSPFYIVWDRPAPGDRGPREGDARSRARLDLAVDDVGAEWARLAPLVPSAKGPPHATRFGGFGFSVKDPEGTVIHIVQDRKA
jgi:catechol 2,3-dioxygenase-like lactoylglutathione lyase family enzyme